MRRLVIALVALVAVLAVLFVRRDTAPPAVPRPGPGAPPAPAPADDAQLAPPPGTTPGAEGSARESVEPAGDGPWLVLEIDPAIQPVSTPIAALVDVDGRPVLDVPATAPMSLAGLSTGRYALVPRAPGWRIEPQEIRIGRETSAHAALFVPGNLYAGHVVDRASQEAVTRASVTAAYQESGNAGVMVVDLDRIPSDGTFRLGGVPTSHGRVRFTFEAEGYVPGSTPWLDAGPGAIHGDLVVELVPDAPYGHALLGFVAYERGELKEAARHLTKAMELDPADPDILFFLAITYQAAGQIEPARALAARFYTADPLSSLAAMLVGAS